MTFTFFKGAALAALLALAACESAEDKAERFYQSGLALLEAGDVDRALVEFRNVFEHDGAHKEARAIYADTQLARGEVVEAYGQYLRLVEQHPDEVEARLTLSEIALTRGDWDEINRHGQAALDLAPDLPRAQAVGAAITYHAALRDADPSGTEAALGMARRVLDTDPGNLVALRVIIDALSKGPTPEDALPMVDRALASDPDALEFHVTKLRLLAQIGDRTGDETPAIAQLEDMFDRFPDNTEVREKLVGWYLSQQDFDAAETVLRKLAGPDDSDTGGHVSVVQFLQGARGNDTARAELERLIAANADEGEVDAPKADLYRAMRASLLFEDGDTDGAIADMRALLAGVAPSDQSRRIAAILARMLLATDDQAGAEALVADILAADTSNVDALKMRAGWQIAADQPDAAITDLRAALSQAPRDPDILTLMAEAHARAGAPELAGERLALAVDVSGAAPVESLRYARFLLTNGRTAAAEAVLLDARRNDPSNVELTSQLADIWLAGKKWGRAEDLLDDLRTSDAPQAAQVAAALQAAILFGQDQSATGLSLLQEQLNDTNDTTRAQLTIVLAQIRSGRTDEARAYLDTALTEAPDTPALRLLSGSLHMLTGDQAAAEQVFRAVLDNDPTAESATRLLYSLLFLQNRVAEADAVLDAGMTQNPASDTLQWIKAGALEKTGDIDGAIAIYEGLYAIDSSNVVVANNLASLIATYRDDEASLARAYTVARRLRGMDVPAFQDTYGWITARRGDYSEALTYLRPAAAGLPDDPLVQYHLGVAQNGAGQLSEAMETLSHALIIADGSPLPQFTRARTLLQELRVQLAE